MKIATAGYPLDFLESWAQYEDKQAAWVAEAAGEGAELLVFPEYGAMELATLAGAEVAADLEAASKAERYYDAFNAGDIAGMADCLSDKFVHDVNEGDRRSGKEAFADFCAHMAECYRETLTDMVVFASEDGTRGAAEFVVNGTYLKTDGDLPEAKGQDYRLPAGGFFTLEDGKITRVTTYYNLSDWIQQVS